MRSELMAGLRSRPQGREKNGGHKRLMQKGLSGFPTLFSEASGKEAAALAGRNALRNLRPKSPGVSR